MDQMATKTLAEIYLQQGYIREALEIFKSLAEKDPQNREIQQRLKELREKLQSPHLPYPPTREEKIRHLEEWLKNIRKRRKP